MLEGLVRVVDGMQCVTVRQHRLMGGMGEILAVLEVSRRFAV